MKTDTNEIMISGLTMRNDNLQVKGMKVNDFLKIKSSQLGFGYIDNNNLKQIHLNPKGLHLNFKGSEALARNFINAIQL